MANIAGIRKILVIDVRGDFVIWFRSENGTLKLEMKCGICGSAPEKRKGAPDKPDLVYVLDCPVCKKTLIEYSTPEELFAELNRVVREWGA